MPLLSRECCEPVDHRQRALLIRLHRKPEPLPVSERALAPHARKDLQRKLQPLGFLGVDGKPDAALRGDARKLDQGGTSSASTRALCASS